MESMLARFGPLSQALLRVVTGFMFACHGAQKLFGVLGGNQVELMSLLGLAGVIELVGGLLVALGVRAQLAAFVCSGQMAAAYFMAHQAQGLLPIQNKGELAVLYCFVFLFLACAGPGPFTLERRGH